MHIPTLPRFVGVVSRSADRALQHSGHIGNQSSWFPRDRSEHSLVELHITASNPLLPLLNRLGRENGRERGTPGIGRMFEKAAPTARSNLLAQGQEVQQQNVGLLHVLPLDVGEVVTPPFLSAAKPEWTRPSR